MSRKQPTVSVVLPTYKRADLLERAIESVLGQTYRDWELVVVDDNDPTSREREEAQAVIDRFAADERIRYVRHDANRGGSAARNTGIHAAHGKYVAFLDDDDEWLPEKLELQVAVLDSAPETTALVYCGHRRVYLETGKVTLERPSRAKHSFAGLLRENGIGTTSAILCRRHALLSVGLFDESLPARQDVDLYLRLAQRFDFAFVRKPLVVWYRHGGTAIGRNRERVVEAHRRFNEKYRAELGSNRRAFAHRQFRLGLQLLHLGRLDEGRSLFWQAWRLWPWQPSYPWHALAATERGRVVFEGLAALRRRLRSLSKPGQAAR